MCNNADYKLGEFIILLFHQLCNVTIDGSTIRNGSETWYVYRRSINLPLTMCFVHIVCPAIISFTVQFKKTMCKIFNENSSKVRWYCIHFQIYDFFNFLKFIVYHKKNIIPARNGLQKRSWILKLQWINFRVSRVNAKEIFLYFQLHSQQ